MTENEILNQDENKFNLSQITKKLMNLLIESRIHPKSFELIDFKLDESTDTGYGKIVVDFSLRLIFKSKKNYENSSIEELFY